MLNEQLKAKIDQEAKAEAKKLTGRVPIYRQGYADGYFDAGEKYAELWQEAEQKVKRYQDALFEIQFKATSAIFPHLPVETLGAQMCIEIEKIATRALTPKPTTDDTANG